MREGLVEGGDALAKGFYRGFTGLINKPLQGAKAGVGGEATLCWAPLSAPGKIYQQGGIRVLSATATLAIRQARACLRPGAHCRCWWESPAGSVPRLLQEHGQQTSTSDSYAATHQVSPKPSAFSAYQELSHTPGQ